MLDVPFRMVFVSVSSADVVSELWRLGMGRSPIRPYWLAWSTVTGRKARTRSLSSFGPMLTRMS